MQFTLVASGYGLVEGPTIAPDGSLFFSDVLGGGVYRAAPSGDLETVVPKRRGVGGIALHAGGGLVLGGRDIVRVHDGSTETLFAIEGLPGWNDLCTDSQGRVYAGALRFMVFDRDAEAVPGELWRIDAPGEATELYGGVVHANGVALSPDEKTIYHSDSRAQTIIVHTLTDDGRAIERRDIDASAYGTPDGMAVDEHGAIWVALVGGGVGRFTPGGILDRRIEPPSSFVTSVCLHGRDLYVTTANNTDDADLGGCVFRTEVEVAGIPVHPARI